MNGRYNRPIDRSMRFPHLPLALAAALAAGAALAQPSLVCAPGAAGTGRTCDAFHYHVQMYRPDNKQFVELTGGTPFATQAACERAREAQVAANKAIVDYFAGTRQMQYPVDRIGPCHCDLTTDRSSASYLTDVQRSMQLRNIEEARLRVRERILDVGLTSDSPLLRGLYLDPPSTPQLGGPKLVPMPDARPVAAATAPDDLRPTKTTDTGRQTVAALDLPLVEIGAPAPPVPPAPAADATPTPATPAAPEPTPKPAEEPIPETQVVASNGTVEPPPNEEDLATAQETADLFVNYETQRIQNVLRASSAIADEAVKSRIYEAADQRINLLSNLRMLIEGSGMRSRLAAAARAADSETTRLDLIARLFGDAIRPHWAPKDAADVIYETAPEIAEAPERVLRDGTGRFTAQQKKQALYLVLSQTQPTEEQRLWLSTVVEGFLR